MTSHVRAERETSATHAGAPSAVAGVDEIRARFPALQRVHGGVPVAYFDGPGGTQVPECVADAVSDYLLRHNANTHWEYPTSAETDAILADARAALGDFLGAPPSEIAFGLNMTTLTFHVARALGRRMRAGDEVIVTELDHHANVAPWEALARDVGVVVRMARMHRDAGTLDWEHFDSLLSERTKVVAIGAASNALGTITLVRAAAERAHRVGALTFVDAVHYAPHVLVDVRRLQCDLLACSAYKFYGPHVGVLWGREALLAELELPKLAPAPDESPERVETGTQNHEGIAGAAAAVEFLASLAHGAQDSRRARLHAVFDELHERNARLTRRLWDGLSSVPGVTLFGPPPWAPRTPTVSFTVRGVPSTDVARRLAARGVFVSHGDFYATTIVDRLELGPEGLVRAGCACYTTSEEIDRLVAGVSEIAAHQRG
ncbi:MAG TPA: cysteine desulfurase-like protein [Gemmatimonadaceae bacterium]|nr:cysteine desulfurase-like protein [Gemmatimonadaceae bacterium]